MNATILSTCRISGLLSSCCFFLQFIRQLVSLIGVNTITQNIVYKFNQHYYSLQQVPWIVNNKSVIQTTPFKEVYTSPLLGINRQSTNGKELKSSWNYTFTYGERFSPSQSFFKHHNHHHHPRVFFSRDW